MSEIDFEKSFRQILVQQCGLGLEGLTPEARFLEDLNLDSLDGVELEMACEEEYMIIIDEADFEKLKTIQQAVDFLKAECHKAWGDKNTQQRR